ncbi:MAG: VWA domain-containing protein [bacterium]
MILWGQPLWLIALAVPALLALAELLLGRRDDSERRRFATEALWDRLAPGRSAALRRLRRWLFIAALIFLSVGLANPRIGTRYEEVTREGIDIVLAVDVSRSMDSQDIRPSRLGKTRYELSKFLEGMKGDRVGLVPFAGEAYPLLPMTLDYAAARMFLDILATDLIPVPGTDIATAIQTAMQLFPRNNEKKRGQAIVIVSDGEDHEGNAVAAAKNAAKQGVQIWTIGMAQAKGDPIPVYDDKGERTGWLTDENGQVVTSRLNEELLRDIADAGHGSYHRAGEGDGAFREVYRELFKLDRSELESRRITGYEDRFQPLLMVALVLLALQFALPEGRNGKRRAQHPVDSMLVVLLLIGGCTLLPSPSTAQTAHTLVKEGNKKVIESEYDAALSKYLQAKATHDSLRPELTYDLAGIYARKGQVQLADSLYRMLPEETRKQLLARADYNRGTAQAQAKNYDQAIESLIDALKRDPKDLDAKRNLEIVRRMQQQQQKQDKQQQQQQQKQDKQQQQQQQNQDKQDQQDQQNKQNEQQQQPPPPRDQMDKEVAKRLLDQLQQDEKELLKDVVRKQIPQSQAKAKKPW